MTPLCFLPGCEVDRVIRRDPHQLVIVAHHRRNHGRCPGFGIISSAVHSRYERHPTDLPSFGQTCGLGRLVRSLRAIAGPKVSTERRILSYVTPMPRSARSSSTSRKLSVKRRYIHTAHWMISRGKR
jgi:hypothetical protein